jgi:hypothetical protein
MCFGVLRESPVQGIRDFERSFWSRSATEHKDKKSAFPGVANFRHGG